MKLAIKRHSGDFIAVVVMLILAIAVTGFILHEEGVRFPFIQSSPFTINADFSTAKSVTPGQGQSVNVSGVKVGLISGVTTKDGYAVVQMQIDQQYKRLIHTNATALLRPKTGLEDMSWSSTRARTTRRLRSPGTPSRWLTPTPRSNWTRCSPRSTPTRGSTWTCW